MVMSPPAFEGSEKRLEVDFRCSSPLFKETGLRRLTRTQLDELCTLAQCEIVSVAKNEHFDAYVLSESSLFVYPEKFVLKTCGTTRLLGCLSRLLELSRDLDCFVTNCKYSRASLSWPDVQPAPHKSFQDEVDCLDNAFQGILKPGSAHVLGDRKSEVLWHVYHASAAKQPAATVKPARTTIEICMNGLGEDQAQVFFTSHSASAKDATLKSGIRELFPNSLIDDFMFEPCGYSMNALEDDGFGTIHITPESGFSYASVELCGYRNVDVSSILTQAASIFHPTSLVLAISTEDSKSLVDVKDFKVGKLTYKHVSGSSIACDEGKCVSYHQFCASSNTPEMIRTTSNISVAQSILSMPGTPGVFESCASLSTLNSFEGSSDDELTSEPVAKRPRVEKTSHVEDVLQTFKAAHIDSSRTAQDTHLRSLVTNSASDTAFYFVNLGVVLQRYEAWKQRMPRVEPLYAVKCFGDPGILNLLATLGCGFDCASPAEIDSVMSLGVSSDRIIYANPCKPVQHLAHARCHGVDLMTFDSESELEKIAVNYPRAKLVLRLRADDPAARCPLGDKYGAEEYEVLPLLEASLRLGLNLYGVSFHVGSGASDPNSFKRAIQAAKLVFDAAESLGMPKLKLLDIGGGFSGGSELNGGVTMEKVAESINLALEEHFPVSDGVRIISEPGRYFAEAAATLCTSVFGRRIRPQEAIGENFDTHAYWISDGLYGSFNCLLYDHATVSVRPLSDVSDGIALKKSTLFGPTCDGLDTVMRGALLPELSVGEWIVFDNMGAYTKAAGSNFNGFSAQDIKTYYGFSK